ncbi:putative metal-dependent hydrolase [Paenibacillus sp. RC84]
MMSAIIWDEGKRTMERYPKEVLDYLVHFHGDRDFFECHEILEEYWKENPGLPYAETLVGLIQVAVGLYHQRRGNKAGAVKMLGSSLSYLKEEDLKGLGMAGEDLVARVRQRVREAELDTVPYADLDLPVEDPSLLEACKRECALRGFGWGAASDAGNLMLIDRHKLRDRSDVVEERARQLEARKLRRKGGEDR